MVKFDSARPEEVFGGYGRYRYGSYGTVNLEGAITGALVRRCLRALSVLHQHRDD